MHARKIALHRNSLIAIVMTLLVIGSALAIAGNSSAISPQTGTVSYKAFYLSGSTPLPASGAKVTVSTLSGYQVATLNGALNHTSLPYGSYKFTLQPYETYGSANIVNGTSAIVDVSTPTQSTLYLNTTAYSTHHVNVTVTGASSPATVSFSTQAGFVFETNTTTGTFSAMLPASGFFATVTYGTQSNSTYLTNVGQNLTLGVSGTSIYAGIVEDQNGNAMQHFNVVAIDSAAQKYTVMHFTDGTFQFVHTAGYQYVITANGYSPANFVSGKSSYTMQLSSSNVTYTYSLESNPGYLNLTVDYSISNSTALPFMPNATIGSFYWQQVFDHFSPGSHATVTSYIENLVGSYTDYSILVNGHNYNETGTVTLKTDSVNASNMHLAVNYTFKNLNVTAASVANGFTVKLFAQGTQYTYGSLYYNYVLDYSVNGISLASPVSVAKTFANPVELLPQTSSGFVSLVFNKVSSPFVTASQINLYWNNTTPQSYLVASNSTSAVFIVPTNVPVSFNLSNAFFNPVTNTNDYSKALNYTWSLNGTVNANNYNKYNASFTFPGFANYTVTVNYTSASGVQNQTSFTVFAYNATPSASLNVSSQGQTLFTTQSVSGTVSVSVPQSNPVLFSAYSSSLTIPGTTYKVPLLYNWYFPGYSNAAVNVSQTFNTPWIASKAFVTGYLNVATAVGIPLNVTLSLNVTDTTPPSPVMTLANSTQSTITQPVAGQLTIFSGNQSTDKYYSVSQLTYSWKITYANGTTVPAGSSTYELMNNNTNLSYFMVKFNTLNSLIVSMKVTNPSNVSAYKNFTTSVVVSSPRLIVQNVYFPTTPSQGASTLVYVNVSNNGTVDANSFTIVALVNGKNVSFQSYGLLPVGVTKQFEFNLTAPSSGSVQFVFEATNNTEPSFMITDGSLTITHNISPPSWQTPVIIGSVILIIVLIGFAYYRFSSRGASKPKKDKKPVTKKTEEKKK